MALGRERPGTRCLWVSLAGKDIVQWARAEVVEETEDASGDCQLRLTFPESCPYIVFRSAVWGAPVPDEDDPLAAVPPCVAQPSSAIFEPRCAPWPVQNATTAIGPASSVREDREERPSDISRASLLADLEQEQEQERRNWLTPFYWVVAFVINVFLAFWLGAVAAQSFQFINAIVPRIGG